MRSPSVKIHRAANYDIRSLPVFGDHDKVTGKVLLDVGLCATPGRLTILVCVALHSIVIELTLSPPVPGSQLQGSFVYLSPNVGHSELDDYVESPRADKNRHIFFTSVDTRPTGELDSPRSTTSLRDAFFAASVRGRVRERRPSQTTIRGALRPYAYSFDIPRAEQSGQELPPTFSSVTTGECGPRARPCVERAEVSYSVTAVWEAADGSDRVL